MYVCMYVLNALNAPWAGALLHARRRPSSVEKLSRSSAGTLGALAFGVLALGV